MKKSLFCLARLFTGLLPLAAQEPAKFIDNVTMEKVRSRTAAEIRRERKIPHRTRRGTGSRFVAARRRQRQDFSEFCLENFAADGKPLQALFEKLEFYNEVLGGYFNAMAQDKDQPVDLDWGEITPVDIAMNGFNPSAHLSEDLFQSKLAFISLLNFPVYNLTEKTAMGAQWDRRQWAYARMGGSNTTRLPAEVNQKISSTMAAAGRYISDYNIFMGSLVGRGHENAFPGRHETHQPLGNPR